MNGKEYLITTAQEVARENERLITENAALTRRAERAEHLLISLTPGGSEFAGSPERCAEWAKDRLTHYGKLAAECNSLRTENKRLFNLAEPRRIGWEGAIAMQERAEAAAEMLVVALKAIADYVASEIFISGGESIEQVKQAREALRQYREVR